VTKARLPNLKTRYVREAERMLMRLEFRETEVPNSVAVGGLCKSEGTKVKPPHVLKKKVGISRKVRAKDVG
jgi:biotin synthase-like enzyme